MSDEPQITEIAGLIASRIPRAEGEDATSSWRESLYAAREDGSIHDLARQIVDADPDDVMLQLAAAAVTIDR